MGKSLGEANLRRELSNMTYGLEADVYSVGVLFGALLFEDEEEEILQYGDDNPEDYGTYLRHTLCNRMILEDGAHYSIAHSLLYQLIQKDPKKRITLDQALSHPYFTGSPDECSKIVEQELRIAKQKRLQELESKKNKGKKNKPRKLKCCLCNQSLPKSSFSKGQLHRRKKFKRKCQNCLRKKTFINKGHKSKTKFRYTPKKKQPSC